jgi:Flp pilus assembly protein TadB
MGTFWVSGAPVIVPLGAFLVAIVAIISGIVGQAHARRIKAEQRMAMLQRGMTVEQIDLLLKSTTDDGEEVKTKDPLRSLGNARRAGIVLVSVGLGIVLFGLVLAVIETDHETLIVAACGLIPLCIGIGFFVDYGLQKRELARFGLEVTADQPPNNRG